MGSRYCGPEKPLVPNEPGNLQAFMAHVFTLLSYWEDSDLARWNGTEFKQWHRFSDYPAPFELGLNIHEMATDAESLLKEVFGQEPSDLQWFKNAPKFTSDVFITHFPPPTMKPNAPLDEKEIQQIAKRIQGIDTDTLDHWQARVNRLLLELPNSMYCPSQIDMRGLFNKHKTTIVELT